MHLKNIPLQICVSCFFNIFLIMFVERYVFPFLPAFVKWCGVSEQEAGTQVGLIAGALAGGRFVVCILWGYLVDTYSVRKCAIGSGICLLLATLGFGFSQSILTAAVLRFVSGLVMGQYIIFQALMCQVCDEDNLAFGMSITLTARLVGTILGPIMGGLLAFPGDKYAAVVAPDGVFGTFPVLFATLIAAVLCAIGLGIAATCLDGHSQFQREEEGEEEDSDRGEETLLLWNDNSCKEETSADNSQPDDSSSSSNTKSRSIISKFKDSRLYQVLHNKQAAINIIFVGAFSFIAIGFDEVVPTLATTSSEYHGMGLSDSKLGIMMLIEGVITSIVQLTLIPKLDKYLGSQKLLVSSCIVLVLFLPFMPATAFIKRSWAMWLCAIIVYAFNRLAMWSGLLAIFCLVTNSVSKENLGTAMSLVNVFISAGRAFSAVAMGRLFSWSLTNVNGIILNKNPLGFPLDSFFIFILLALMAVILTVISCAMCHSKKSKQ